MAAAPRWSLEGVEEQQLAQSALSRIPAGSPAAERGAEPHGRCGGSVRLTVCCCPAPLSKAADQAVLPPPIAFPGKFKSIIHYWLQGEIQARLFGSVHGDGGQELRNPFTKKVMTVAGLEV